MKSYTDAKELIEAIQLSYQRFIDEFSEVPDSLKDERIAQVDRTPSEMLSYQLGWVQLLLSWEKDEAQGKKVQTPAPDYKWNNLGGLYQSFYQTYGSLTLEQQKATLDSSVQNVCDWIKGLSSRDLFEPNQREWATSKAQWPLWKWIHINTVAPFTIRSVNGKS